MKFKAFLAAAFFLGLSNVGAMWATHGEKRVNRPGLLYWYGDRLERKVALTFDDGPSEPFTGEILDILKAHNVKGTFFVVGRNVERYPRLAQRIVEEGHTIGNHSWTHVNLANLSLGRLRKEIILTNDIIEETTGVRPILIRAPYGSIGGHLLRLAASMKTLLVQWTISPRDWKGPQGKMIVKRIMGRVKNGSIILLHDGRGRFEKVDRSQTVAALPELITTLQKQGFEIVSVPELLKVKPDVLEQVASWTINPK